MSALIVIAHVSSSLAGDPPMLDAIVEYELGMRQGCEYKLQRHEPAPEYGEISIPILRQRIGGLLVPCCSSPILSPEIETVEYYAKRLSVENADLIIPKKRRVVTTSSNEFKSYRLPLHIRIVKQIVWFVEANRKPLLGVLKRINSIGKKRSQGFGRIEKWTAERIDDDFSWFVNTKSGQILMRPLPDCDDLPDGLIGTNPDFGSVQPPYWHPDRFMERVVPC